MDQLFAANPEMALMYPFSEVARRLLETQADYVLIDRGDVPGNTKRMRPQGAETNVSKSNAYSENEPSIAISRKNPDLIVVGANEQYMYTQGMVVYHSTDRGTTWTKQRLPKPVALGFQSAGDPIVVAAPDGGFYYSFLTNERGVAPNMSKSDIQLAYSPAGKTWTLSGTVNGKSTADKRFEDKEYLTIDMDPASPHYGRLYVVWTCYDFNINQTPLKVAYSDDKGQTWTINTVGVTTHIYSQIQVGKNGTVFVTASKLDLNVGEHNLFVSTDGGTTFTRKPITTYLQYPIKKNNYPMLKGVNGVRIFPYSSLAIDPATNGLHVVAGGFDSTNEAAAIYYHYSSDEGSTWTTRQIGLEAAGRDLFFGTICFDTLTDMAHVSYYSSQEDPQNKLTTLYRVAIGPGGSMTSIPIQSEAFDPVRTLNGSNPFVGDYMSVDAHAGYLASVWTQRTTTSSQCEIYGFISAPGGTASINVVDRNEKLITGPLTHPVSEELSFEVDSELPAMTLSIYDLAGRIAVKPVAVVPAHRRIQISLQELPAGTYVAEFSGEMLSVTRTFVKR